MHKEENKYYLNIYKDGKHKHGPLYDTIKENVELSQEQYNHITEYLCKYET